MIDTIYLTSATGWEWKVVVRNVGNAGAGASVTGVTRAGQEVLVGTPALAPGASVTVRTECPYGSLANATARADATNVLAESNEADNNGASAPGGGTNGRCRHP